MAMGGRAQREATSAISACRPFSNSTGSLRGTRGPTRDLGWLSSHQEARKIKELLSRATYVVWSYDTPIGFVSEDENGERTAYYIDEPHSVTTSHHQTLVRVGFSDFETIGEGPWSRSAPRGSERRVGSDRMLTDSRGRRPDLVARGRRGGGMPDLDFSNRPGYVSETAAGFDRLPSPATEHAPQSTLEYLLDHRLSDPDWVPGRDPEADYAAEQRDAARVEREQVQKGPWRP